VSVIYSLNSTIYCDKCTVGWSDHKGMSNVENIIFIIVTRFNGSECWQRKWYCRRWAVNYNYFNNWLSSFKRRRNIPDDTQRSNNIVYGVGSNLAIVIVW